MAGGRVVLDTNVVLDLLLFADPSVRALHVGLQSGSWTWLSTAAMRAELERVLRYPQIVRQIAGRNAEETSVLAGFDRLARLSAAAPPAALRCSDPDDQMFLDLAVPHQAVLLSKDRALLKLAKGLAEVGVAVRRAADFVA